jgi:aminopeptidase YwaD
MTASAASGDRVFQRRGRSCLSATGRLLKKHRYRSAGTEACREAAREVAVRLRACCDSVQEQTFTLHPLALWYVGKAVAVNYLLTLVLLLLGGYFAIAGSVLCLVGLAYSLSQYVFYLECFDRVFPAAVGCNVVGSLEPEGDVWQQVVLVGHHDSPFIFTFLERFPGIAFIRFLLAMLAYAWLCGYSVVACIGGYPGVFTAPMGISLWISIAGLPFALQLYFMMAGAKSPGAGDNLNGTSMIAGLGEYFRGERGHGRPLRHTRLVVLSTDGEEIGQRGAIAFVRSHARELRATPTRVLNVDSVYRVRDLTILTRDRNGTCRLSDSMVSDVLAVARGLGHDLKRAPIPFGGGGTDAAAFAVAGFEAVSIVGMPMSIISTGHRYHTSQDVVENIEAGAVAAVLAVAAGYIRMIDGRIQDPGGAVRPLRRYARRLTQALPPSFSPRNQ